MVTITLSHLLGRGVRVATHEAVALARELMAHPCGIPTPENIQLGSDGSVSCISRDGVPSVASVADLLLMLLPPGTPNVPPPLRYAIARGLEAVEAPPFPSLSEFSSTLSRFEKGASRDVLRGILQRGARPLRPIVAPTTPAPQSMVVPQRPTLVVPDAAASSREPRTSIAAAPRMFTSLDGRRKPDSPVRSSRWWGLPIAVALVASFTAGFVVIHGIIDGRIVTTPTRSARVSPAGLGAPPAANDSAANLVKVERRNEKVRAFRTPKVPRTIPPRPAATRDNAYAAALTPRRPVGHASELAWTSQAVGSTRADASAPAFASDGTAIFFSGGERDARSGVDVASTDNETARGLGIMTILDDRSHDYHAQPSPDGHFVAFDSDRDGERGIYVANRDGSHVRRVSGAGYAAVPTWSPNNEWLAYIRPEMDKPSVWNLWVQPAAGGSARRLTNYRDGQTSAASWFLDARHIAYSHEDTLMVMDLQTDEATRYQAPVKGQLVQAPAVSPDGTKIIFQVYRDGAWLLDLAHGSMARVLTDPTVEQFAWAPDGRRIAFHSRRDGHWGIYVL